MSYTLEFHAAGPQASHHITHKDVPKGAIIEPSFLKLQVIDKMAGAKLMVETAAGGAALRFIPSPTAMLSAGMMMGVAHVAQIHIMKVGISQLLLSGPGRLNLFVHHDRAVLPDRKENKLISIHSGSTPANLLKDIYDFLEKEDFAHWGPIVRLFHETSAFLAKKPGQKFIINATFVD